MHDESLFEDSDDWPLHDHDKDGSSIPVADVETDDDGSVSAWLLPTLILFFWL